MHIPRLRNPRIVGFDRAKRRLPAALRPFFRAADSPATSCSTREDRVPGDERPSATETPRQAIRGLLAAAPHTAHELSALVRPASRAPRPLAARRRRTALGPAS